MEFLAKISRRNANRDVKDGNITTDFVFRELKQGDEEAIVAYYLRNAEFHKPWFPTDCTRLYMKTTWTTRFEGYSFDVLQRSAFYFAIFDSAKMIGQVNVNNIERGSFQNGRLGYSIDKDYMGHGLMSTAVQETVGFAFQHIMLHRLEANIISRNISSRRVLEKNKFIKIGYSPRYLSINGSWEGHDMYMRLSDNM